MKWSELKAQGVKRCCATFTNGSRCRRRATERWGFSYCDKHGPVIQKHTDFALKAIREQEHADDKAE